MENNIYYGLDEDQAIQILAALCKKYDECEQIDLPELIKGLKSGAIETNVFRMYMEEMANRLYEQRQDAHTDYQIESGIIQKAENRLQTIQPAKIPQGMRNQYNEAITRLQQAQSSANETYEAILTLDHDALDFEAAMLAVPEKYAQTAKEILIETLQENEWPPQNMTNIQLG